MTCTYVLPAQAGASNIVVDNSSFREKLDTSVWNNPADDVMAENGVLVFPKESTESTALITKTNAKKISYGNELVSAQATMNLSGVPSGETFALALGLSSLESELEEDGNIEVRFTNQGGMKVSLVVMEDVEENVLVQPVSCGSAGKVTVSAVISSDSVMKLSVNGKQLYNAKLPVTGEGRVGFLQSGSCQVKVTDVKIITHEYDRPENCDIYEDFEGESINRNLLTAKMINVSTGYEHSRMLIEEMNGNRVWRWDHSGHAYLGTMYQYSNFEMTFDVVYLQRTTERAEDGTVIIPQNANFAVSYGDEASDYGSGTYGYLTSTDMLLFGTGSTISSFRTDHSESAKDKGYPFYATDCNKNFTVRVSMIDSVLTVGMKWQEEKNFTEVFRYQPSEKTPTGYIHIWTTSSPANFAIDNLSIVNKDESPNLVEVEFNSAVMVRPDDYKDEPLQYVYAPEKDADKESKSFNLYLLIPIVATVCLGALGVTLAITKKGGSKDEK